MSRSDAVAARIATTDDKNVLALAVDELVLAELHACEDAVLLREQFEGEVNTLELASWNLEVACSRRTSGNHIGIEAFGQLVDVDVLIVFELDAFFLEKMQTAVDDALVELEVWNAVTQQATGVLACLEDSHLVAFMVELVGSDKSGRSCTDDGNGLAVAFWYFYAYIVFRESVLNDGALVFTVGGRLVVHEVEDTGFLAESRTDTSCELRKVVGGVEQAVSQLPVTLVEGVVPLRSLVAQRASPVTEGYTAIHAARSLLSAVVAV